MSYECRCNDDDDESQLEPIRPSPPPRPNNYPANIELPNTLNEIVSQLRQRNYNHPGLLAAFSSLTHGRSSKNAYILLIGSSGAGKSSAINNLLNSPNVTLEGTGESTTSEIIEFRIPIPVDSLGVSNSQLRIIDTPGLG
ncbi:putative ribosome biogenesis GTPase RsgA, partial [Orchesella cincta]